MPGIRDQLTEVVSVYTSSKNQIETRHLPNIARMFDLEAKQLLQVPLLHQTPMITVEQAVSILQDLP